MTRLLARIRCAISASHDTETVGNVTTCRRGCGLRVVRTVGLNRLSPRERDVLRRMLVGRSYSEIASDLGIGLETVKAHVVTMYAASDTHSREELYTSLGILFPEMVDAA